LIGFDCKVDREFLEEPNDPLRAGIVEMVDNNWLFGNESFRLHLGFEP
jgi:hypothetical protein